MRETCESCVLHFRAAPGKPGNPPPCSFQSPHQELWSPRSISCPSSLHSKEHCPHFMAGSTRQPDLGNAEHQCQGTGSGQQRWRGAQFLQNFWSLLLKCPCGWDSMWHKEILWMTQLETLPWLQLPYNLCFKLCFQASVQPLNAWQVI